MEYEDVQSMSRGEVESYMRDLWSRHDPDPATGRNELRDVFEERKGHADRFFGTSFRSGKLTDRGRVYVRYGAPDEINKELNPQDNDVLAQVLPKESASDESISCASPARGTPGTTAPTRSGPTRFEGRRSSPSR
jgi:GWxTD domain-containing protein